MVMTLLVNSLKKRTSSNPLKKAPSNEGAFLCLAAAVRQQGQVKVFIDLPDVVFAREHPVAVLMHHHPAVALEIGLIALQLGHLRGQLLQQFL